MSLMPLSLCVATGQIQVKYAGNLNYILKPVILTRFLLSDADIDILTVVPFVY